MLFRSIFNDISDILNCILELRMALGLQTLAENICTISENPVKGEYKQKLSSSELDVILQKYPTIGTSLTSATVGIPILPLIKTHVASPLHGFML